MQWVKQTESGNLLNQAYMWKKGSWKSNEVLHLDQLKTVLKSSLSNGVTRYTLNPWRSGRFSMSEWRTHMEMLALYSHLTPPKYQKLPDQNGPQTFRSIRYDGRLLDLSWWFGRPCLIVMGFLPDAPIPVDINVDGKTVRESKGVTFVRWVYPLEQTQ